MEASAPVLVSHTTLDSGTPTSGICFSPVPSRTGRFVLFSCQSSDVVDGEPGIGDLIQNDSLGGLNSGVGLSSDGQWGYCQGAELGTCGAVGIVVDESTQQAVFNSGAPLTPDAVQLIPESGTPYVFLRNEIGSTTTLLTPPPQSETSPAYMQGSDASIERSEVLFSSVFNLLGGVDSNGPVSDLYVRNWLTGSIELVSAAPDGSQSDAYNVPGVFSQDGRYVAFLSSAGNLTGDNPQHLPNLFLRDRYLGTTRRLTFPSGGGEFASSPLFLGRLRITADAHYLMFSASGVSFTSGDDPALQNLYLLNLASGAVEQLPRTVDGLPPDASISSGDITDDGRRVVFASTATNVASDNAAGVFIQDLPTGQTIRVSSSLGVLMRPLGTSPPKVRISLDGSTLAFEWPSFNATFPTLLDDQQIYRVAIWNSALQVVNEVPALSVRSATICFLLIVAMALNTARARSILHR